eukprot:689108-Pyramimonas_sp.AAC.1
MFEPSASAQRRPRNQPGGLAPRGCASTRQRLDGPFPSDLKPRAPRTPAPGHPRRAAATCLT